MSKLIQTRSPFISYCKEEPAQETQTSCYFPWRHWNPFCWEFSLYSAAKICLFQTFCIISSVFFTLELLLVSLPTLPPNIQQVNIAWLMMWSTLHVSLYRKTLGITTMGDGRRGREKRGILKCSVVFNASNKKETLKIVLFHEIARYLAELTLEKENFNKLLGSRKIVREID